jgi:hypothetical protein
MYHKEKNIIISMPKNLGLDTATGELNVTITSQVVVYAPSVSPLPLSLQSVTL